MLCLNKINWSVNPKMDIEPPRWWRSLKLQILWKRPLDPRKKIKKFLKLGDEYFEQGELEFANFCYERSKTLAKEAGTVHLLKKIEQRIE